MTIPQKLRLKVGGDSIEAPVTPDGLARFERITGASVKSLPDDPRLAELLPVLIWCLVAEINPSIRARDVSKLFDDPAVRQITANAFLKQIRPGFRPSNN